MIRPTIYKIRQLGAGFLAVMAKPVSGEWIADEFRGIANLEIHRLVSLMEAAEMREVGLAREREMCLENGIDFIHFPIRDRGLPGSLENTVALVSDLHAQIESGKNIVIHYRAGINRFFHRDRGIMSTIRIVGLGLLLALLAGCGKPDSQEKADFFAGKPVPQEKADYIGEWQSQNMYLNIEAGGAVNYRRQKGGTSTEINSPIKEFHGNDFDVGMGPLSTTFVVSKLPYQDGGQWKMVVDGELLTRTKP